MPGPFSRFVTLSLPQSATINSSFEGSEGHGDRLAKAWAGRSGWRVSVFSIMLLVSALFSVVGCGSGGYAGSGISSLSASSVTIDGGQSFQIGATVEGNVPVTWSVAGASCSGAACGSVASGSTGDSTTYTAPSGKAPMQGVLTAP